MTAALGSAALSASPAHAHIDMYGELKDRGGDQKTGPCGGVARSAKPYVFEPGATIALGVDEFVNHDGYFRVSFDDDGEDDFVDPKSIDPLNPNRYGPGKKCQGTAADSCGESDFCSVVSKTGGPTVLLDNLDPHVVPTAFKRGTLWNWTVTLPNVECDNCTIQVMQVMEDPVGDAHGPFDGKGDLYYRCIDIQLKKGVGKTPGTVDGPAANKTGIDCVARADESDAESAGSSESSESSEEGPLAAEFGTVSKPVDAESAGNVSEQAGGCSLTTHGGRGAEGALALLLGGLFVARSRRRRQ